VKVLAFFLIVVGGVLLAFNSDTSIPFDSTDRTIGIIISIAMIAIGVVMLTIRRKES